MLYLDSGSMGLWELHGYLRKETMCLLGVFIKVSLFNLIVSLNSF